MTGVVGDSYVESQPRLDSPRTATRAIPLASEKHHAACATKYDIPALCVYTRPICSDALFPNWTYSKSKHLQ